MKRPGPDGLAPGMHLVTKPSVPGLQVFSLSSCLFNFSYINISCAASGARHQLVKRTIISLRNPVLNPTSLGKV